MMKSRTGLLALLLLLTNVSCSAWQSNASSSPASKSSTVQFDQYFEKALQDWELTGMSVAIVKDGKVVLSNGYGYLENLMQRAESPKPADGNTLYAIASNTKAFISTAIGMLVEEGKLEWNDPVVKHLPYFKMYDDYVTRHITVRDLLCHRSGLGTFSGDVIWYKSNYTPEEAIRQISALPAAYPFRSGYGYSNLMYITAGEVIKAASGKSWNQFLKERIFTPLSMQRTRTSTNDLQAMTNVATPHKPINGQNQPIEWVNWDNMGAAGGIISSVNDMAKWMQLQLNQGLIHDQEVFSGAIQTEWWTPHNSFKVTKNTREMYPTRNFSAYGLGWGISDQNGKKVVSHGGGYDGMYSKVVMVPEEKLGVVVLTNGMKGISTAICNYVLDHYLTGKNETDWSQKLLGFQKNRDAQRVEFVDGLRKNRLKNSPAPLSAKELVGQYNCDFFGPIDVQLNGQQLELKFPNAPKLNAKLKHWHYSTYEIEWDETHAWFDFGTVQFVLDNRAMPIELRFDVPNNDIFFHEIKAVKKR